MHVLLPTDVFPPKCGGAGWSAHALASGLRAHGHDPTAIVPQLGAHGESRDVVLGVPTVRVGYRAPNIPFVKNYARHERFWPKLADAIVTCGLEHPDANARRATIIHAQHVQTAPAAVIAGERLGVPVVVTVRDHWPWDYFATGLHGNRLPYEQQTWASLATDLVAREGPAKGAVATLAIPYILAHMRRRQAFLEQADAVIAVSNYIAERLSAAVPRASVHVIPNMVDMDTIAKTISTPPQNVQGPFLLYVGKLDRNKGAHLLIDIFREIRALELGEPASSLRPPASKIVIAGDGPLRPMLERELAELGVEAQFLEWAEHDEVLRLMAHCELLLFPSAWGEPLSRVWLEAAACGAAILAMPTGGVHDVIVDAVNGALEPTPERFARRLHALLTDDYERRRLGMAAQRTAQATFRAEKVVGQVDGLYHNLLNARG